MVGKQLKAAALVAFLVAIVSTFATAQPSTIPGPGIQLELAAGTFANLDLQEQPGAIVLMHSKVGGTTPPALQNKWLGLKTASGQVKISLTGLSTRPDKTICATNPYGYCLSKWVDTPKPFEGLVAVDNAAMPLGDSGKSTIFTLARAPDGKSARLYVKIYQPDETTGEVTEISSFMMNSWSVENGKIGPTGLPFVDSPDDRNHVIVISGGPNDGRISATFTF